MFEKVTVQIPTYNQEKYLARAIDSVLMQDYPNIEIVIADDNSTDGTEVLVKKYSDERIKYFKNEKNLGRVGNYRKALYDYSTGEWVINLDGDDYYTTPAFISRGMKLISLYREKGHNVLFYQAAITVIDEYNNKVMPKQHHLLGEKEYEVYKDYYYGKFRANVFFSHLTTIYNRQKALEIGFYEYNTLTTDFESMMKLSFYGEVILDSINAGVWRLHDRNATLNARIGFRKGGSLVFERLPGYAKEAFGEKYEKERKKATERETEILHLELLAENGTFLSLLKYVLKYRRPYHRLPVLIIKSAVLNIKEFFSSLAPGK